MPTPIARELTTEHTNLNIFPRKDYRTLNERLCTPWDCSFTLFLSPLMMKPWKLIYFNKFNSLIANFEKLNVAIKWKTDLSTFTFLMQCTCTFVVGWPVAVNLNLYLFIRGLISREDSGQWIAEFIFRILFFFKRRYFKWFHVGSGLLSISCEM